MALIALASAVFIRFFNVRRLYFVTFITGVIFASYAFMQTTGKDFIKWNNPYNAIIGTVGNPNFASALMAIMGVVTFTIFFLRQLHLIYRIAAGSLSVIFMLLIIQSNSRQGILSFLIGVGIFLIIWLFQKGKYFGFTALVGGVVISISAILGMLQKGPMQDLLYKDSVSVRGYYWRAGIEMFQQNPLFGVGMDRFGAYFKEYREVGYPLSYGFEITSTNAHNTFIQFFATGGLLLGVTYLVLNGFILWQGIVSLKNLRGVNRIYLSGLLSAWIAFHSQSLISIDNIGVSIWGWVLGGAIIGLSISGADSNNNEQKYFTSKQNNINLSRVFISSTATFIILILVTFLYRGEVNSYQANAAFDPKDQIARQNFKELQLKAINTPLNDPNYSLNRAIALLQADFIEEGLAIVEQLHTNDPRNLDILNGLALLSEDLKKDNRALTYRLKMAKLDPWNAVNYLAMGKIYKSQGNLADTKLMLEKIMSFAAGDPISSQAKLDLAF
jgi:O-antigen ligase